MHEFFSAFSIKEMLSATITLFAVIDIIGAIPIILSLRQRGMPVNARRATIISSILLLIYLFGGNFILDLFNVDIYSFAVAGSFILFLMALEMILDVEIFKNQGPMQEATLIPIVFPLVAGPASFTTLLSLYSITSLINLILALILNMAWVFVVLNTTGKIEKILGKSGIYIARKFFGIILIAVSVGMCVSNITMLITKFEEKDEKKIEAEEAQQTEASSADEAGKTAVFKTDTMTVVGKAEAQPQAAAGVQQVATDSLAGTENYETGWNKRRSRPCVHVANEEARGSCQASNRDGIRMAEAVALGLRGIRGHERACWFGGRP